MNLIIKWYISKYINLEKNKFKLFNDYSKAISPLTPWKKEYYIFSFQFFGK